MEEKGIYRQYSYVLFGSQKVGKTNIITRFTKDQFTEAHTMTLQGQQSTFLKVDGKKFKINLHDTAGQQGLITMKAVWRSNKDAFIFVFAIDNLASFENICQQIKEVQKQPNYSNMVSILIGNKFDLDKQRKISTAQARMFAKQHNMKYMNISAKTSKKEQIQKIFLELIDQNEMKRFSVPNSSAGFQGNTSLLAGLTNYCENSICRII